MIAHLSYGAIACKTFQLHLPGSGSIGNSPVGRQARFEKLRAVLKRGAIELEGIFRAHRGTVVYVWFGDPMEGFDERQPQRDASALVEVLRGNPPPASGARVVSEQKVSSHGPQSVVWDQSSRIGLTWSSLPKAYASAMVTSVGFELGLAYGIVVAQSQILGELMRLVPQHD